MAAWPHVCYMSVCVTDYVPDRVCPCVPVDGGESQPGHGGEGGRDWEAEGVAREEGGGAEGERADAQSWLLCQSTGVYSLDSIRCITTLP